MADHEDRPKKSWREIDKARDGSVHRKEAKPDRRGERQQRSNEYRAYKSQLNKLFDGQGGLPEGLKAKLAEAPPMAGVAERQAALEAIKSAQGPSAILAAFAAYRAAHGFPEDEEALGRLLDLTDEAVVGEAIATIERLRGEGRLKRAASFRARLETVQMTIDDPEIQRAAKALLRQLR